MAAVTALGGVPAGRIRYDNLSPAVKKICHGRSRIENERWTGFRSHFGFDAFYCRAGREGAHEKGGVEGEGGRFRRTHLVPVPSVASLAELNERLAGYDTADDDRRIGSRTHTVGFDFAHEAGLLRPVPAEPFDTTVTLTPRVDRHSRISVRQVNYSVPARLVGRRARVALSAHQLGVYDGATLVATHPRSTVRGSQVLTLDHYLDVLTRKPGALPGALALAQARTSGVFTPTHDGWWAAARAAHPGDEPAATQALIEVLGCTVSGPNTRCWPGSRPPWPSARPTRTWWPCRPATRPPAPAPAPCWRCRRGSARTRGRCRRWPPTTSC